MRDAKKVGIAVRGGFIFGDVNETMETVNTTCNWIRKNRDILPSYSLDCIRLFPGSPLYDYAVKNSFITDTVKHIQDGCPPINISKMSDEEYDVLRQEILLEMYNLAKSDSQEVFSLDASGKSYKVTIGCSECSAYNEYAITPEEVLGILAYPVSCKCCGYYYSLYLLHPYIDWIESKLQAMNAKDRCALKGLGAIGHQIMQVSNAFKTGKNSPVLIDANPKLQGVKIEGLPVQHPDEVDFSELDTIIICTVHFESIKKRLSAQHPHLNIVGFHQIGLMNV